MNVFIEGLKYDRLLDIQEVPKLDYVVSFGQDMAAIWNGRRPVEAVLMELTEKSMI